MKLQIIHIRHCLSRKSLIPKHFMDTSVFIPSSLSPVKNQLYHWESVLCLLFILLSVDASNIASFAKQHIRILLRLISKEIHSLYLSISHIILCDILQLISQLFLSLIQGFRRRCQKVFFLYLALSLIQKYIENIGCHIRIRFKILRYKIIGTFHSFLPSSGGRENERPLLFQSLRLFSCVISESLAKSLKLHDMIFLIETLYHIYSRCARSFLNMISFIFQYSSRCKICNCQGSGKDGCLSILPFISARGLRP